MYFGILALCKFKTKVQDVCVDIEHPIDADDEEDVRVQRLPRADELLPPTPRGVPRVAARVGPTCGLSKISK